MIRLFSRVGLTAALLLASGVAMAQQWPTRPINFLYGNQPGGFLDTVCRMYAERIQRSVGQPVIFEVKPVAGGILAAQTVTQARPDGHTIMLALGGMHTVRAHLQQMPFDPVNDFELVMLLMSFPSFLAVPANSPAKSVADLVALAKSKPNGLSYGTPGPGSPMHLMGALFKQATGANMEHIGYRGGPPMLAAFLGGEVDFAWPAYSQIRGNPDKIRPLAVADTRRSPALPDVPTFEELGYKGVDIDVWFGITTTKGTPQPIVARLRDEFIKAGRDPEIQRRLAEEGYLQRESTPAEFRTLLVHDYERLGKVIRENGIKAD